MAQNDCAPSKGLEDGIDFLPQSLVHDTVKALSVIVYDPPGIAQIMLPAFLKAFIDIAFVQLGIPHEGDHAAKLTITRPRFGFEIILHQRSEGRDRDAKANRACGEVDIVHILGAARIGLRAAIAAKILELFARLVPHHVLHGMEDRRGMRLHRNPVFRTQCMEIEGRHDRHHRGARGLVAADFHVAFLFFAEMVGIVHDPGGQPKQALLHGFQRLEVGHCEKPCSGSLRRADCNLNTGSYHQPSGRSSLSMIMTGHVSASGRRMLKQNCFDRDQAKRSPVSTSRAGAISSPR